MKTNLKTMGMMALGMIAGTIGALPVAQACMPAWEASGRVRCPHSALIGAEVTKAYEIAPAHEAYANAVGNLVSIDLTEKKIVLPVGVACPEDARCIWGGIVRHEFTLDKVSVVRGVKTFEGRLRDFRLGVATTIKVIDYTGMNDAGARPAAATVITLTTRTITPRAPDVTSTFFAEQLAPLMQAL